MLEADGDLYEYRASGAKVVQVPRIITEYLKKEAGDYQASFFI